jgi:hypothetical protein
MKINVLKIFRIRKETLIFSATSWNRWSDEKPINTHFEVDHTVAISATLAHM